MGGWGSSRWRGHKKRRLVEDCLCISVTPFARSRLEGVGEMEGVFTPVFNGARCEIPFTLAPVTYGKLRLDLHYLRTPEQLIPLNQTVPMIATAVFGNRQRWYFLCPYQPVMGKLPNRRCAGKCLVLYLPLGEAQFGCRECLSLTYRQGQRHNKTTDLWRKNPYAFLEGAVNKLQVREQARVEHEIGNQEIDNGKLEQQHLDCLQAP